MFFLKKTCSEQVSYIFSKRAPLFSRDETFLYFLKKSSSYQNPGIFRTRDIFRTLSNIYDGTFCKNSYLAHFLGPASKFFAQKISYIFSKTFFLYFKKYNFLALRLENFLYFPASALNFQETNFFLYLRKGICPGITELSYISGNKAFSYSSLIFQDVTFRARKMKKPTIIFQEMELSNSKIKKLLTFQERTCNT